jgi:3-hydroxyisobutyrate dehydrogenase-like beta-hydroxyacid dehydrogenase
MASASLGFIGVGIMGEGMVKNILKVGFVLCEIEEHDVV